VQILARKPQINQPLSVIILVRACAPHPLYVLLFFNLLLDAAMHRTIIEPFRIKSVEPLRRTTPEVRRRLLEQAGYNLFSISSESILIE